MRPTEMERIFRDNGLEIMKRNENITATQEYLKDFFPRLQQAANSIFRTLPQEELSCISCQYIVKKKGNGRACCA